MIVSSFGKANTNPDDNATILDELDDQQMLHAYEYNAIGPMRVLYSFRPLLQNSKIFYEIIQSTEYQPFASLDTFDSVTESYDSTVKTELPTIQ